jgi:hypothetical protein
MKRKPIKLAGFKVGKLTVKPGDILVLKSPEPITDQTAKQLVKNMGQVFKKHNVKTIVLGDGLDIFKLEFEK